MTVSEIYKKYAGKTLQIELPENVFVRGVIVDYCYEPDDDIESLVLEIIKSNKYPQGEFIELTVEEIVSVSEVD